MQRNWKSFLHPIREFLLAKQDWQGETMAMGEVERSGGTKRIGRAWYHQPSVPRLDVVRKALCLTGQLGSKLGNNE